MSDITKFSGEYRWLSNFYPCNIYVDTVLYPSVEHAYQAAKTIHAEEKEVIRSSPTAGIAKKLGKHVTIRDDWEEIKIPTMANLLWQKFMSSTELANKLKETSGRQLVEGNTWGDTFWGVCRGTGSNHLGELLMSIRKVLLD